VVEFLETSVFDISKEWFKQEIAKKQGLLVPVRHLSIWDNECAGKLAENPSFPCLN
jgi:hypothetical protein